MEMLKFKSIDSSELKDRGTVKWVIIPPTPAGKVRSLVGQEVMIDGVVRRVIGVDTFAVSDLTNVTDIGLCIDVTPGGA